MILTRPMVDNVSNKVVWYLKKKYNMTSVIASTRVPNTTNKSYSG